MPGLTNNTTLLNAANQIIVALNEQAECNAQNLIKTNLMMIAAMTGQTIDLDDIDDNFFTGSKDYTAKGLANRLGPEALHSADTSISARIKVLSDDFAPTAGIPPETVTKHLRDAAYSLDQLNAKFISGGENIAQIISEMSPSNMQDLIDAVDHLADQFIYDTIEEQVDITAYVKEISEILVDLRDRLFVFDDKNIAQIVSELPLAGITTAVNGLELVANCAPDVNVTCAPDVNVTCGGGGGGGDIINGERPLIDPPGKGTSPTPPTDDYKCKAAATIIDDIVGMLRNFGSWYPNLLKADAIVVTTLIGLAIVGNIASAGILTLVGGIVALLFFFEGWAVMAVCTRLADEIESGRDDLLCGLYNSQDTAEASGVLNDFFNDAIDTVIANVSTIPGCGEWIQSKIDVVEAFLLNLIIFFTGTSELNRLFPQTEAEEEAAINAYEGSVDCGACGGIVWTPQPGYGYYCHIDHQNAEECVVHSVQGARFGNPAVPTQEIIVSPSEACTIHVEWTGNPNCWHWDAQHQNLLDIYANPPPEEIEMVAGNWLAFLDLDRNPPTYFEVTITYV